MPKFRISRCYVNRLTWLVEAKNVDEAMAKIDDEDYEQEPEDEYLGGFDDYPPSEYTENIEVLKPKVLAIDCKHPEDKLTIPQQMRLPRLGVTCLVECSDCEMVVGNCLWVETAPLNFELKFNIPYLKETVIP